MRIVTRTQWLRSPWKNGKGVTFEIGRGRLGHGPELGDAYHWRLSVAEIASAADFSVFDGYERFLGVIDGAGILMTLPGEAAPRPLPCFGSIVFDGALAVRAGPMSGPTRDINLMVLRSQVRFQAEILERPARMLKPDPAAAVNLFVCLRGAARIQSPVQAAQSLQQYDSLLLERADCDSDLALAGTAEAVIFSAHLYAREPV